jgi:parallel beta-helix repeat protein
MDLSANNSIVGGDVNESYIACIHLYNSSYNNISMLNITSCLNGIYSDLSSNNFYTSNNISANDYGIQLMSSSLNNMVWESNISNSFVGIAVNSSYPNQVNHNSILGNVFYAISAPSFGPFFLDAENNYFGTNDIGQIAKLVTSYVDYTPSRSFRESNVEYIANSTQWTSNQTLQKGVVVNKTGFLNITGTQQSPITIDFNNIHGQNFIQVNNVTNLNNSLFREIDKPYTLLYLDATHGKIENSNISDSLGIGIQSEEEHLSSTEGVMISNCSFYEGSYGLVLHKAGNTSINESVFDSNEHWGIYVHSSNHVDFGPKNNISHHERGFLLEESITINITENTLHNNTISGITFEEVWPSTIVWLMRQYAEYNNVTKNIFIDNNIGMLLGNTSRSNNVTENDFTANQDGTYIVGSWSDGKHEVASNEFHNNSNGVRIADSIYNNISKNSFFGNKVGVYLEDSTPFFYPFSGFANTVANNLIRNMEEGQKGIYLVNSERNFIYDNNIIHSTLGGLMGTDIWGLLLESSSSNTLSKNNIQSNEHGIRLHDSGGNNLTFNEMTDNFYNFGVTGTEIEHFPQEINTSNKVNGAPIYYWVGVNGSTIPTDAGYVGLVNSQNITVTNVSINNNYQGILIVNTSNSMVDDVRVTWTYYGLYMKFSNDNSVTGNSSQNDTYFAHNTHGMHIYGSSSNTIENCILFYNSYKGIGIIGSSTMSSEWNNISRVTVAGGSWPSYGIFLQYSRYTRISNSTVRTYQYGIHVYDESKFNTIEYSNVSYNKWRGIMFHSDSIENSVLNNNITLNSDPKIKGIVGLRIWYGSNTITCLNNNFAGNEIHAEAQGSNDWDNGSSGNYWSGHNCTDDDGNGICDTEYNFYSGQKDKFPLAKPADAGPK